MGSKLSKDESKGTKDKSKRTKEESKVTGIFASEVCDHWLETTAFHNNTAAAAAAALLIHGDDESYVDPTNNNNSSRMGATTTHFATPPPTITTTTGNTLQLTKQALDSINIDNHRKRKHTGITSSIDDHHKNIRKNKQSKKGSNLYQNNSHNENSRNTVMTTISHFRDSFSSAAQTNCSTPFAYTEHGD